MVGRFISVFLNWWWIWGWFVARILIPRQSITVPRIGGKIGRITEKTQGFLRQTMLVLKIFSNRVLDYHCWVAQTLLNDAKIRNIAIKSPAKMWLWLKNIWTLRFWVHFQIRFHLSPLIIFDPSDFPLPTGFFLATRIAVRSVFYTGLPCLPCNSKILQDSPRKKDKDKKKGAEKKKGINEDSVAANKKGAAAAPWRIRMASGWGPSPGVADRAGNWQKQNHDTVKW